MKKSVNWTWSKWETLALWKTLLHKWKSKPQSGRIYLQNKNVYGRGLEYRICKELLQLNNKRPETQYKKKGETNSMKQPPPQASYGMASKHTEDTLNVIRHNGNAN